MALSASYGIYDAIANRLRDTVGAHVVSYGSATRHRAVHHCKNSTNCWIQHLGRRDEFMNHLDAQAIPLLTVSTKRSIVPLDDHEVHMGLG